MSNLARPTRPARRLRVCQRKHASTRRLNLLLAVAVASAVAFAILNPLTRHPGETVILLMPPALAVLLWFGWPASKRWAWWEYAAYGLFLAGIVAGAEWFVAYVATGRVIPIEILWAIWFIVAWRLAWVVWSRTAGRLGERWRRWGRRTRFAMRNSTPHSGSGTAVEGSQAAMPGVDGASAGGRPFLSGATRLIAPARIALTVFVFVPLVVGSLIHRFKVADPAGMNRTASLPVENVSFRTEDGLILAGWFLPEPHADSTVIICHGAGANKSNFVDYMRVFRYQGYNSLIFDFRGHGGSDGHTSTFGLFEDADVRAAVDWLKTQRPLAARHVYGLGSSMGAMALVRAAAKDERIEAVVLDSCFVSAEHLAAYHLARVPVLGRALAETILASMSLHAGRSFRYLDAREAVATISPRPVLFIHGRDDILIPPAGMEILYDCARPPKDKWLGPGPHSNIMTTDFLEYQRRVLEFLGQARRER